MGWICIFCLNRSNLREIRNFRQFKFERVNLNGFWRHAYTWCNDADVLLRQRRGPAPAVKLTVVAGQHRSLLVGIPPYQHLHPTQSNNLNFWVYQQCRG